MDDNGLEGCRGIMVGLLIVALCGWTLVAGWALLPWLIR